MDGIVVFIFIGAAVLIWLALLWYLIQTVRIMWAYNSLLAIASVIFTPIVHIIFYFMPKDNFDKHEAKLFKKYFLSVGLIALLGVAAGILIPAMQSQKSIASFSNEDLAVQGDVADQENVSDLDLAVQGDVAAQWRLGQMYYKGEGVRQDYEKAAFWYEKAAAQGNPGSEYYLGVMYYNGEGVRQDYAQAKEWVGKACDSGLQIGCDKYKSLNQ